MYKKRHVEIETTYFIQKKVFRINTKEIFYIHETHRKKACPQNFSDVLSLRKKCRTTAVNALCKNLGRSFNKRYFSFKWSNLSALSLF